MSKAGFEAFWDVAQHWRAGQDNMPGHAAPLFHRAVANGVTDEEMLYAAIIYTEEDINPEPRYQASAAHWLAGWGWQKYIGRKPTQWRELTAEETAAWHWSPYRAQPRAKVGEDCWPPGHERLKGDQQA